VLLKSETLPTRPRRQRQKKGANSRRAKAASAEASIDGVAPPRRPAKPATQPKAAKAAEAPKAAPPRARKKAERQPAVVQDENAAPPPASGVHATAGAASLPPPASQGARQRGCCNRTQQAEVDQLACCKRAGPDPCLALALTFDVAVVTLRSCASAQVRWGLAGLQLHQALLQAQYPASWGAVASQTCLHTLRTQPLRHQQSAQPRSGWQVQPASLAALLRRPRPTLMP
jgi:hypothetical protein